jgi:hypothetical protein
MSDKNNFLLVLSLLLSFSACKKNDAFRSTVISPGNDPNFEVVANIDEGFSDFNRKVVVLVLTFMPFLRLRTSNYCMLQISWPNT